MINVHASLQSDSVKLQKINIQLGSTRQDKS